MNRTVLPRITRAILLGATIVAGMASARPVKAEIDDGKLANSGQLPLSSGQFITPMAATGAVFQPLNPNLSNYANYNAGLAVKSAVSPDGNTLLILTSGYNLLNDSHGNYDAAASTQFVFVYDISGANARAPVKKQVIQVPNAYVGMVWAPDSSRFYVSGGVDDKVWAYSRVAGGNFAAGVAIALNHPSYATGPFAGFAGFIYNGIGFVESAVTAGLGLSPDGSVLVAANMFNDSISVIDTATNTKKFDYDLRPFNTTPATGSGVAGGEAPFAVAMKGNGTAYVSSIRDREVVVLSIGASGAGLITRIALPGNPNSMIFNADQSRLYVTQDNSDTVAVIDTASNAVLEEIDTRAPAGILTNGTGFTGATPNNLVLSPDGSTLYVTNGGANSVAVIPLGGSAPHRVSGLLPTGWYPNAVSLSADGGTLYVVNGKSDPGRNPAINNGAANQYVLQLEGSGFLTMPVPSATDLAHLTRQVAANNFYNVPANTHDTTVMNALKAKIQHVIYIVKENRTFDQVLGDLPNGANGDPSLTMYGRAITPNFHRLAANFVTLDNFLDSGEVSGNGWAWSTAARESDHGTKTIPPNYAGRGFSNDSEGQNRIINMGIASPLARAATYPSPAALGGANLYLSLASAFPGGFQNLLPGTNNDFATDGPIGTPVQSGYLWDAALRAGLTVRNYGFFLDITRYNIPSYLGAIPNTRDPHAAGLTVAYPASPSLAPYTDPYFRGFDNAFPDVWRVEEWKREFDQYVTNNNLPNLTLLRLMHDHMGNFSGSNTAVAGLTTPETQQADNDLAVGRVIEAVAHSKYASSTLVFVIEDDAQDGPDHMDAHRSTAYVVGPYVRHNAVVSTRYTTVNMVRTIEDVLGLGHLNLNDAYQRPMTDIFDLSQSAWNYNAVASPILKTTLIALGDAEMQYAEGPDFGPVHNAAWWGEQTDGFDWSAEDRIPADLFNRIQWQGLKGDLPYPTQRSGKNRGHRKEVENP